MFAGLLLTAGSIGDRFGRRHALLAGLATFLAGSIVAATAGSTTALIAGRCVMGLGGAFIMPTTLSILVNVFGDPRERAKAIAAWTAASGAGIALGPIVGGALMRSFSWSSVFWINVPLLVVAFVGAMHVVPDSRDPHATRLDPIGAVLSIASISSLVYAIIQAPERGWTSAGSIINFAIGIAIGIVFVGWEMRRDDPMLDIGLFRNRSFSAGSIALALLFFAMAGTVFLQAQYLQFVLDYTPLAAGFALVPAAIGMLLGTGAGAHLAAMHGGRIAVTAGTLIAAAGVAVQAALVDGGVVPADRHRSAPVRPRRRHRDARRNRDDHGHPPTGPRRRRLGRQRHRPRVRRRPRRRRHRQHRRHRLRNIDARRTRPLPQPDRHRSRTAHQQRRCCHPHQPPTRSARRPDRFARPQRVRRLDEHVAVDRRGTRFLRRTRRPHPTSSAHDRLRWRHSRRVRHHHRTAILETTSSTSMPAS